MQQGKKWILCRITPLYPSISYYLTIEILNCVCLNWEQGTISTLTLKLNAWHKSSVKKVVNTFLLITFPITVNALYYDWLITSIKKFYCPLLKDKLTKENNEYSTKECCASLSFVNLEEKSKHKIKKLSLVILNCIESTPAPISSPQKIGRKSFTKHFKGLGWFGVRYLHGFLIKLFWFF